MRILGVKGKNINSLRGDWSIDLSRPPLSESVFALIGDMGSGKSTILDSITLALYNAVPRIGDVSKDTIERKGAILTRNEKDCFVEVKYSCSKGIFTSRWSISTARTGNLRDYEMQVFDADGKPLTSKKSEVPKLNVELIGLSYEQFVSAILLSQGQFAKFLNSNRKERAQLLEEITGMKQFTILGRRAYQVYGEKRREIEDKLTAMEGFRRVLKSADEEHHMREQVEQVSALQHISKARAAELELAIGKKKTIIQAREKASVLLQQKDAASATLSAFEQDSKSAMEVYGQLLPYKDALVTAMQLGGEIEISGKLENQLVASLQTLERELQVLLDQISFLVKTPVRIEDAQDTINDFQRRVEATQLQEQQARQEIVQVKARLKQWLGRAELADVEPLYQDNGNNKALLDQLVSRKDQEEAAYTAALTQLGSDPDGLPLLQEKLKQDQEDLAELLVAVTGFVSGQALLKADQGKLSELASQKSALGVAVEQRRQELNAAEQAEAIAGAGVQAMLTTQKLDEHRARLVEGEPCPLCGSTVHPYVHSYVVELAGADIIHQEAKSALKLAQDAFRNAENKKAVAESQVTTLTEQVDRQEKTRKEFLERIDALKLRLNMFAVGNVEVVKTQSSKVKDELEMVDRCLRFQQAGRQMLEQARLEVSTYDQCFAAWTAVKETLASIFGGQDLTGTCSRFRSELQKSLSGQSTAQGQLEAVRDRKRRADGALKDIELRLLPELAKLGYPSVVAANQQLMPEQEYLKLNARRNQLVAELSRAEERWSEAHMLLEKAVAEDSQPDDVQTLETNLQVLSSEMAAQEEEMMRLRQSLFLQEETRGNMRVIETEVAEKEISLRPWEMLNHLIGDKFGNKFNTYAQDLTLKHLLVFANRRLGSLHSRYRLDMAEHGEDENDLVVVDTYMGGERRTVKTLSGGETFMVSLALALGLSDLASRNIRIDSLFIDEGFGSLDGAALEDAMVTLDKLQAESDKNIGIISHVESLKERFSVQIQLQKQSNGFSTMRIVPEMEND